MNALDHRLSIIVKKSIYDVFLGIYITDFLVFIVMKNVLSSRC